MQQHPPEAFLYYIWHLKRFNFKNLKTTQGEQITIIKSGYRNEDAGPDFLNAELRLGNDTWYGHIEMHVRASDWNRHKHQEDPAYSSVILHVVYDADCHISLPNGEPLACLEMKDRIDPALEKKYRALEASEQWIPCENLLRTNPVPQIKLRAWYERLLVDRLEAKTHRIAQTLEATHQDWEEAFYRLLARNFGFKKNADAFEALATSTPRSVLLRHKNKLRHIEALLYGQSGLLPDEPKDDYTKDLKDDYRFYAKKYSLTPLEKRQWKFMRMRPANFPTVRIAQFSVLSFRSNHLFSKALAAQSVSEICNILTSEVSGYWKTHYTFEGSSDSKSRKKTLGNASIELIIINTIVPFLFYYGARHQYDSFKQRAMTFLEELKSEKNHVLSRFADLGLDSSSAFDSQALLQLKSFYCVKRKCLHCAIGNTLLNKTSS